MDLQGPDFSDSRDLMIIFTDSWDPIFNSGDPNWVPITLFKKPGVILCAHPVRGKLHIQRNANGEVGIVDNSETYFLSVSFTDCTISNELF